MDLQLAWEAMQDAAPYALAILVALTALVHAMRAAARAFERWAAKTASKRDDQWAATIVAALDSVARVLDAVQALLPRVGFGRRLGGGR